jgi:hypothetical protein
MKVISEWRSARGASSPSSLSRVNAIDDGLGRGPFVVEVPMFTSQYLEMLTPTGRRIATGTGFFVLNADHVPHLITNRHNVTGRHWQTNTLSNRHEPSAVRLTVPIATADQKAGFWTQIAVSLGDEDLRPIWLEHPTFGWQVDVVAIPLGHIKADMFGRELDYVSYPRDGGPARIGIANDVFTIGFPIGFDPIAEYAFPIWMRGSIAWPPRLDWNGKPAFLIDSRTRQGQSGAPVVFYADETMNYVAEDGTVRRGPAWGLLGVYSGRLHEDSDIGVVWKRSVIDDILTNGGRPDEPNVSELEISCSVAADAEKCPEPLPDDNAQSSN